MAWITERQDDNRKRVRPTVRLSAGIMVIPAPTPVITPLIVPGQPLPRRADVRLSAGIGVIPEAEEPSQLPAAVPLIVVSPRDRPMRYTILCGGLMVIPQALPPGSVLTVPLLARMHPPSVRLSAGIAVIPSAGATTAYRDSATRLRLSARNFRDVASRLRLHVRRFRDMATRLRLRATNYRQAVARFVLSTGIFTEGIGGHTADRAISQGHTTSRAIMTGQTQTRAISQGHSATRAIVIGHTATRALPL